MKADTPLENAVRMLDLKLETLPKYSAWTAADKSAMVRMSRRVVDEFYKEREN